MLLHHEMAGSVSTAAEPQWGCDHAAPLLGPSGTYYAVLPGAASMIARHGHLLAHAIAGLCFVGDTRT